MNAYFTTQDENSHKIYDFAIPDAWWSRLYEYVWAQRMIMPGQVVVDAGAGPNYPLQYVLAETCKVYSIDISPDILNSKPHPNITHMVAGIENIPLPDNSVDTVYCISVLEHLTRGNAEQGLKEFKRILKPGGRAVITIDASLYGDTRYTWARDPDTFFKALPAGMNYSAYEKTMPDNAIKETTCGLTCYHAVLYKE